MNSVAHFLKAREENAARSLDIQAQTLEIEKAKIELEKSRREADEVRRKQESDDQRAFMLAIIEALKK